ncbi:hypothetical protein B9Z19DRAFT_744705 [Tuber borchii]|uniref:Uncharacterized protein n=1 Tax=Tuber borchii TaxID=42251 RepID=A0A2T6ZXM5_TUBBO|nr:hypothetical protein B9Z19DRAFT_744705 [Tuber borchii]
MSQIPSPMPPEGDRHIIIVPLSQQPEPRLEPSSRDSRSPTPELPANFVPKPPLDASQFPAASTILTLMERMAGGNNIRDLIMVPAATWDHNNSHWEFRLAQLKKNHKKDWAKKEVELRRKYDEEFSDARYRQMLVEKEMKELEFMKTASNQTVFGKTWDEHKAEKQRIEESSKVAIEAAQTRAEEYETLFEELKKQVDEKEAVIKALQSAITGRAENHPPQQQFGNPIEVSIPPQQFMYPQAPVQGPSTALVVHPRGSAPPAQIHMQPPPRIVDVSHGTLRGSSIPFQHVTPSNRHPPPSAPRDRIPSQDVRVPDRGTAFRNATPRSYDSLHNPGGGGARAPDKHHNMRDKSRDSRSTVDIQLKREYQSDRENHNNIRGRVQELNSPRDGRAEETSRTALRTEVSLHTRAQSDHWPADIAAQAQHADLWRPPRRLASNEIQTIQRIEPRVAYPTPSQPAAWAKKFVTPPGGNIHPKSDPKQGSQSTQGPLGHGGISGLTGMSKSANEKTTSVGPPISAEPQRSLIKTKPVTLFLESSESDKAREETSQFKDPRVSRKRQSTSAKEKTVGNQKLRGRAGSSSPDGGKATKRRKRDRGVVSELPRAASRREKLGSTSHDDIASSLVDYGSASDSETSSSEGYTDSQLRRGISPLFLPKFKSPTSHKKVPSLAKPTTRGEPLYDFEVESGDLFGDSTVGYTDNFPRLDGIGVDTEEVERLIEETDITPVVSDFNSRMPRRIEPKTEPETPIEVTVVKQPRSILEIYDDAKKKSIMVYNSRKFKRVLTISVIPDRYSKDPQVPSIY